MLTADDRWAIGETISLHGHLFDEGQLDRLDALFTLDVVYDVSGLGFGVFVGIDAIRDGALALGRGIPWRTSSPTSSLPIARTTTSPSCDPKLWPS